MNSGFLYLFNEQTQLCDLEYLKFTFNNNTNDILNNPIMLFKIW